MSRMMFRIRYHKTANPRLSFDGKPSTNMIAGDTESGKVLDLAQHFLDTIKRIEEKEGVPLTYVSIEFADVDDPLTFSKSAS